MDRIVVAFMGLMGTAIAVVWGRDIRTSPELDRASGLLRARDRGSGELLVPHWVAEFGTSVLLLTATAGRVAGRPRARQVGLLALGALLYTSVNSLSWALAKPERRPYAVPMVIGVLGSIASAGALLAEPREAERPGTRR